MNEFDRNEHDVDRLESMLLDELRKTATPPDMSRRIMGRLGYMRSPDRVARRSRTIRRLGRVGITLVVLLAALVGIQLNNRSPEVMRSIEAPTVSEAVDQHVTTEFQRINSVLGSIRQTLTPDPHPVSSEPAAAPPVSTEPPAVDEHIEMLANLPGRWV